MIKRLVKAAVTAARRFRESDLYRRAFTGKKFPEDSQAREPRVPTVGDRADIELRRTSGDEFIMTVAKGKGQLEGMQEQLDMELQKHRQKHNYILDDTERPSTGEVQKEALMERLDDIREQMSEGE